MNIYPLKMRPFFCHSDETPWGGNRLRELFGKAIPNERTGESLEISALPGHESAIENGECAGLPLSQVVSQWGEALTGRNDGVFPLLLKLLDARESLSVQVHPEDGYAMAREGGMGKNEAWYVLNAEPGAKLVYGLDTKGERLETVLRDGRLEECLLWQEVHPGEVYYIPSGTVHALGPGIQCYEIQQASDITYRLWDWDRVDGAQKSRTLDVEKALEVIDRDAVLRPCAGAHLPCEGGSRTVYVDDAHFAFCRLDVSGAMPLEGGRMSFITPLNGVALRWKGGRMAIAPYESVLIPARLEDAVIEGEGVVLASSAPACEAKV